MTTGKETPQRRPYSGGGPQGQPQGSDLKGLLEANKPLKVIVREIGDEYRLYAPDNGLIYTKAKELAGAMKMTQLRRLFAEVQAIARLAEQGKEGWQQRLKVRIQPFLAYANGRGILDKKAYSFFKQLLRPDHYRDAEDVRHLKEIFQALVGYAKSEGGAR